jgi:D-aspartate ligase
MREPPLGIDRNTPALIVKVGQYPLHSGGLGAIRTLGRLGVPVYAMTENGFTPAALSRYLKARFLSPVAGKEEPEQLAAAFRDIGRRLGRRSVVIPTDDEAAVLIAEHAGELSDYFFFPQTSPGLPRNLASKWSLYELCRKHGIPAPVSVRPSSRDEVAAFAAQCTFPVIVKNAETWMRLHSPVVSSTKMLYSAEELLTLAIPADGPPGIILQEYIPIPQEQAQDWNVQLYCDANSTCLVSFTGFKVRSWPPYAGATACAYTADNPHLAQLTELFCKEIGYKGIADLDWRFDRRDGQYKLMDFNPRVGNQFRLYETTADIDVVRALHLDLTGREVPVSHGVKRRKIIVEDLDLAARLAYKRSSYSRRSEPERATTELAWLSADDPLPFLRMLLSLSRFAVTRFASSLRRSVLIRRSAKSSLKS